MIARIQSEDNVKVSCGSKAEMLTTSNCGPEFIQERLEPIGGPHLTPSGF